MSLSRLTSSFVLRVAIYYSLSIGLWTLIGNTYGEAFRKAGMWLFRPLSPEWIVVFAPETEPHAPNDSVLAFLYPPTRAVAKMQFHSRYIGYAPTALLLSLILATPVPLRRRAFAVLFGMLLLHVWFYVGFLLATVQGFCGEAGLASQTLAHWTTRSLSYLTELILRAPVLKFAMPALLWAMVTLRRGDRRIIASRCDNSFPSNCHP